MTAGESTPSSAMTTREVPTPPWPRPVRERLDAIDWDRSPIVDVVTYEPATSRGLEGDRQRIEVHRYSSDAPPPKTYQNDERGVRVARLTAPLYERPVRGEGEDGRGEGED